MRRFLPLFVLATIVGWTAAAHAATVTRTIDWTEGGIRFRSVLVWDDSTSARRPGLLMVPNWYGVNAAAVAKAARIAGRDSVVLVTDVYGENVRPKNATQAGAAARPLLGNRVELRRRMQIAFDRLRKAEAEAPIDDARLGAIGFCFGGAAVLDLARSGSDVKAVVSFHGELGTDDPALDRQIRARVLVMNGADDALTAPDFAPFETEMRQDPAPWQFVLIGHAVHCFTEVEETAKTGMCRYDPDAAAESYAMMRSWLAASFEPLSGAE